MVSLKEFLLYRIWALFVLPATAPAANAAQDGADGPAPEPWLSPEELWQSIPELSPWEAVAEDVGGGEKGNHVDIYCDSHAQAKSLPFQSAQVFLLR